MGLLAGVLETSERPSNELKTIFGAHRHALYSADFWIRELWLELSLSDLIGIPFYNRHTLTWGAFEFELGRGISLGASYPMLPFFVGFFIDYVIDQFPFGAKLSGDLCKDRLSYDIYGAILANYSATFEQIQECVQAHQYGHRADTARDWKYQLSWSSASSMVCTSYRPILKRCILSRMLSIIGIQSTE